MSIVSLLVINVNTLGIHLQVEILPNCNVMFLKGLHNSRRLETHCEIPVDPSALTTIHEFQMPLDE